jgi:hypothetical protein
LLIVLQPLCAGSGTEPLSVAHDSLVCAPQVCTTARLLQ